MHTIYGIPNCDTMKKAFTWLNEHKVAYTFHNYKTEGIPAATIQGWLKRADLWVLINTRSTTWKELPEKDRAAAQQKTEKAIALMQQHSSMIKRPVLDTGKKLLIGFDAKLWEKELL